MSSLDSRAYLQKHRKENEPSKTPTKKPPSEMTWPEMQAAYREKRHEQPTTPPQKKKQVRHDWDKVLESIRDILFDAPAPMSASAIHRSLGEHAPAIDSIITRLHADQRFQSDKDKRWTLAKEEAPEDDPKKNDEHSLTAGQW